MCLRQVHGGSRRAAKCASGRTDAVCVQTGGHADDVIRVNDCVLLCFTPLCLGQRCMGSPVELWPC
eukprot:12417110-Karenia_brevis.AAC.1